MYHYEGGERLVTNLTRLNMLFIVGSSLLLYLELISPCNYKKIMIDSFWILAWSVTKCLTSIVIIFSVHDELLLTENCE